MHTMGFWEERPDTPMQREVRLSPMPREEIPFSIAVVLNSTNGAFPDTTSLLDYGFDNFEKVDLNIDTDPVPAVFLPCEKHLLKDWNNLCSFYYMRHVYVTVPTGTDVSQLVKKQKLLNNSVGPKRIKSKYYLDGHMVGYGMQYEKEILSRFPSQRFF